MQLKLKCEHFKINGYNWIVTKLDKTSLFIKYGNYQVIVDGYPLREFKTKKEAIHYVKGFIK